MWNRTVIGWCDIIHRLLDNGWMDGIAWDLICWTLSMGQIIHTWTHRIRLSRPQTRTHAEVHKSMKWCSVQTWWILILTKPPLSSAECQLSRDRTQRLVGGLLTSPPHTRWSPHLPLPAYGRGWQRLKLFYRLGGISRPICGPHVEWQSTGGAEILG